MAELETQRTSETILITISRAKKLRGSKGEILTSYAKVEFDGKSLGDSSKVRYALKVTYLQTFHVCLKMLLF